LATASTPIMPPAPGRLSMTTGWPNGSPVRLDRARDDVRLPPGGKVTTTRIGFAG